ncbi:MAG: class I tRNA ligase family protein, partial [Planctomycetales bacterium]|nr:class I tRNA ligase family protein [Planctomycetales bacterium]
FFVIYANIDGFDPAAGFQGSPGQLASGDLGGGRGWRPCEQRGELDRWVLSELQGLVADVARRMDEYDSYGACQSITQFLDGLSNWYVRRSRDRFWAEDKQDPDKLDAYWTLYECLTTFSKIIAPFVPFVAEAVWRNLTGLFGDQVPASVHLCDYPTSQTDWIDSTLATRMEL